jgi:hypothetical protein
MLLLGERSSGGGIVLSVSTYEGESRSQHQSVNKRFWWAVSGMWSGESASMSPRVVDSFLSAVVTDEEITPSPAVNGDNELEWEHIL